MPNAKAVSKDELRAEIAERLFWGNYMANLLTTFVRDYPKHPSVRAMKNLARNWDEIESRRALDGRESGDAG
jgi:hypothetical protein